ncbi:hypothetical protein HPP92_018752 [Vanilla planifolia]|uniref:Uncharacterized protein n=1 Tax=Vanilla planifolia TaxID=51239 RepID=A0A835UKA9_VANPL|nr:hypothetical protein HPP92_018752 [Vanilla planifolia]
MDKKYEVMKHQNEYFKNPKEVEIGRVIAADPSDLYFLRKKDSRLVIIGTVSPMCSLSESSFEVFFIDGLLYLCSDESLSQCLAKTGALFTLHFF